MFGVIFIVGTFRCADMKLGPDITELINAEQKLYTAGDGEVKHEM